LLLAKQNNFDIRYRFTSEHEIDAPLYIVPGITGDHSLYGYEWESLIEKVKNGAVLYVSMDNCAMTMMGELFGVEVTGREVRAVPAVVELNGEKFTIPAEIKTSLNILDGEILACEDDGNPVFVRKKYGKGWCYLLTLPIEKAVGNVPGAFLKAEQPAWRNFYAPLAEHISSRRRIFSKNSLVTMTEHPVNDELCYAVAINNSKENILPLFEVNPLWEVVDFENSEIKPFTAKVIKLKKNNK
jgi:hypothetical protein